MLKTNRERSEWGHCPSQRCSPCQRALKTCPPPASPRSSLAAASSAAQGPNRKQGHHRTQRSVRQEVRWEESSLVQSQLNKLYWEQISLLSMSLLITIVIYVCSYKNAELSTIALYWTYQQSVLNQSCAQGNQNRTGSALCKGGVSHLW